ncbi:ABCG24 [Symbiodinium natans]|uniref:ABCG24 protein n=1 Tax=Symbiodinium natans TaxID=878477 RepID=A0A812RQN4_9DINO|nr:ABCG24 [Symbiodinium natans]
MVDVCRNRLNQCLVPRFTLYIWPFVLVSYVASGWGFAISCCLPVELGAFISSILAFMMGGILGLPMQMSTFLNGGFMEVMVGCISFTRWSVSMSFLEYITLHPPDTSELGLLDSEMLKLWWAQLSARWQVGACSDM